MAPGRWDDTADRDLILNILMSVKGDGGLKIPWDKVKGNMDTRGHDFTTSAMR